MLRAIFWKEWRQQRLFQFAILILIPLAGVICWTARALTNDPFSIWELTKILAVCAAIVQAIVTGSLLFAGELEGGTLDFLDACSAERGPVWRAKMLSGLTIALPALVLPTLVDGVRGLALTGVAAEILLISAAVSVFVRTSFRTIAAAAILSYLIGIVLAFGAFGLNFLIVGIAVVASRARFCRHDRERHGDYAPIVHKVLVRLRSPSWMTASLWLLVHRHWLTLVAALGVVLAFVGWQTYIPRAGGSEIRGYQSFVFAPAVLFAIGCAFGWNVFALEQAGAERFLGDQRFPRTRLWLAKVGVWLALMIVATWVLDLACDERCRWVFDWNISPFRRGLVLGLLGFAAGQFFGMHARQLPVAIFLTLLAATPMAAVWYAPLFRGEPAWHFSLVPILFLAATRLELRPWTTGRLEGTVPWIRCGLVVLGCFAWTGLVLWHRIAEVPDVGEPFVMTERPTETPLERERNLRLMAPAKEAWNRSWRLRLNHDDSNGPSRIEFSRWHEPDIDLGDEPSTQLQTLSDQVFALGAPDERRDEFARMLTDALAGDWSTSLRKELVDEPRRVPVVGNHELGQMSHSLYAAARIYCLKSFLLLAEGKPKAALDDFGMSLALVRHCVLFGGNSDAIGAWHWNDYGMLEAAETMLRRGGDDPDFCRGMLALLNRHAQEMPSFSDVIKGSYSATYPPSARSIKHWNTYAGPVAFLFDSPFESIRDDRLERAFCRGLLKAAEQKTLFLSLPPRGYDSNRDRQIRYLALATPDRTADDWRRIMSHQSHLWLNGDMFDAFNRFPNLAGTVARRNAIRLACAAALFRHDHGRELVSLAELAPEYFPTLPESPYAECEFVHRRSSGETWKLVDGEYEDVGQIEDEKAIRRTIAPGTGVIEMTGKSKMKVAVPRIR